MTSQDNVEDLENSLLSTVRYGGWRKILIMITANKQLRTAKVTVTGDTVLHMAVSCGRDHVVETLLDLVCGKRINKQDNKSPSLPSRDENDYHIKLVLGAKDDEDPFLTAERNNAGETPLFMAALHGKRETFLWLYYRYTGIPGVSSTGIPHCIKRDNDDTILHCALEGGYIDVAIEIVLLYKNHLKEMVRMRNKNGLSPIHFLAAIPSAFQSTHHIPTLPLVVQHLYYHFWSDKGTFALRVKEKAQATTKEELEKRKRRRQTLLDFLDSIQGSFSRNTLSSPFFDFSLDLILFSLSVLAAYLLLPLIVLDEVFFLLRSFSEKHVWSAQIVEELLQHASEEDMSANSLEKDIGKKIYANSKQAGSIIVDTPLMIAAQNGRTEMVEKILEYFPSAMNAVNEEKKNTVLLAAEKRQTKAYKILCENKKVDKSAFRHVDKDGNTALHLAAKPEVNLNKRTTIMVEEYNWFEFVKNSLHSELREKYNNGGKTAEDIFIDSCNVLASRDREWLNETSRACSVVSTLVTSVALENVSSNFDKKNSLILALSLSLTSTISFLAILVSRSQSPTFFRYAFKILQVAMLAMFGSIFFVWINLMLHADSVKTYAILGSPIAILTIASLPMFIRPTLMSKFTKVPSPSNKITSPIRYRKPQKKEN
ncbi:hypothetical protein K1719_018379 [Acacia pycnantha]|nr:hypothetical protein K1719_018379 [Acacia pycnantha]